MMNRALSDLSGGWHVGPLFVPQIVRPPVRPKGKEGLVHRRQTRRATPHWANTTEINLVYAKAQRLSRWMGELYVVDHIVPKISDFVCGLHVTANLRIIHWLENAKKGAAWWPDMWFTQLELFGE